MNINQPPRYCNYVKGECPEDFTPCKQIDGFFLYPTKPSIIANTIELAVKRLTESEPHVSRKSWKSMDVPGRIIFCEVCKNMRFSSVVITDVTSLNFNLLFELGYALALGLPVIPIRDTSYIKDKRSFTQLGTLETLGYLDFINSESLAQQIQKLHPVASRLMKPVEIHREQPIFLSARRL